MKPIAETYIYDKFGCMKVRATRHLCPTCGAILNAGPNYTPKFCGECGEKLDFTGVEFPEAEELGFDVDAFERIFGRIFGEG